jgi:4-hydroxybenzoate polyprenyltransferase
MPSNFLLILELMRLSSSTGYLLVFFPAFWGLTLASTTWYDLREIPLFFIGSILARGAGCIVNDILDQKLDSKVERTKNRPLASGRISTKEALTALFFLLLICLAILLSLSVTSIIIGCVSFLMILMYPMMKRLTYFPQIFLGIVFNQGCLIAYASVKNTLSVEALILYLGCCFWTISYDTIYGFMDIRDDRKAGIYSLALFLEKKNYRFWLSLFYAIFIVLFYLSTTITGYLPLGLVFLASLTLLWQVITLEIKDPVNCRKRFKSNNFVGILLALAMYF